MSALPMIEGRHVLEIGHGPGHALLALARAGYQVFGLDPSFQMSKIASLRLKSNRVSNVCINGYAQYIPFVSASFDTVFATFPTDYIIDTQTLSEAWRILRSKGKLVILPTAWILPVGFLGRLLGWLFRYPGQNSVWGSGYAQLLREAGFDSQLFQSKLSASTVLILVATKT